MHSSGLQSTRRLQRASKQGSKNIRCQRRYGESQKKFQEKEHIPFELLSDQEKKLTSAFGVPLILGSFATRQAYLFKDGKLVWMDMKASTDQQAQDVLTVLAE